MLLFKNDLGGQLNETIKIKVGENKKSFSGGRNIIRKFLKDVLL